MAFQWKSAATILLMGAFVAVRLIIRADECLDGDEIFSLEVARQSWLGLWEAAAHDVSHPPLFYALLKVWIGLGGESLSWLRLLPALTTSTALIPLWGLCSVLGFQREEKNLALALMCLNGFALCYSIQLRMYSLLLLASLCSLWAFANWLHSADKNWRASLVLLAASLFVIYSHYWGWVLVGCQGIYLLAFAPRSILKFSVITCLLVLAYLPWVAAVIQGAAGNGSFTSQIAWITRPGIFDVTWFYSTLLGNMPFRHAASLALSLAGTPLVLWAWDVLHQRERPETFRFLLWFAFLPTLLTFAVSTVQPQSIWAERSLIICMVPFVLLISRAACRLPGKAGIIVPLALFAWAMVSGMHYLSESHKLPWESLATQLASAESGTKAPVPIYAVEGFIADPLRFYSVKQRTTDTLKILRIDPQAMVRIQDLHCWIVYREFGGKVRVIDQRPEHLLDNERFRFGEVIQIESGAVSIRAVLVVAKEQRVSRQIIRGQ